MTFSFFCKTRGSERQDPDTQSRQSDKIFSSRRNWDSFNPSPAGECAPPTPRSEGRGTLAGERGVGRVPIPTRGHTLGTLYIYVRTCTCYFTNESGRLIREFGLAGGELLAPDPLSCGSDELLVGRAGYILGGPSAATPAHPDPTDPVRFCRFFGKGF